MQSRRIVVAKANATRGSHGLLQPRGGKCTLRLGLAEIKDLELCVAIKFHSSSVLLLPLRVGCMHARSFCSSALCACVCARAYMRVQYTASTVNML